MDVSPVVSQHVVSGSGESASNSFRMASPVANFSSQPNDASASKVAASAQALSSDQVAQAVKQVNDAFSQRSQNLYAAFEKDKITGIDVIKIVDKDSKETIIQFPSKAILEIAQDFQQSRGSVGQFIHDNA